MYYTCEDCKYIFESNSANRCEDCGSVSVRESTPEEIEMYYKYREIIRKEEESNII